MPHGNRTWPDGNRLKAARELAGLSVLELAAETGPGLGRGPIQEIERGTRLIKDGGEAARLAKACGISPAFFYVDFLDGIAEMAPPIEGDPMEQLDALYARIAEARKGAR